MADESCTYAATLIARTNVGVANEVDIAYWLNTHHADNVARSLVGPKDNSRGELRIQLQQAHIRVVPSVRRNDATIRFGPCIDNLRYSRAFVVPARADRIHEEDLHTVRYQASHAARRAILKKIAAL